MGLRKGGCGLAPGLVVMDRRGQGQGLVAKGRDGARLMQGLAICGEALPGPLEGEGGFPRRGDETEKGEGRGQGSGVRVRTPAPSGAWPPASLPALHSHLLLSFRRALPFLVPASEPPVLLWCLPRTPRPLLLGMDNTITAPKTPLGEGRRGGLALSHSPRRQSHAPWLAPLGPCYPRN